MWKNLRLHLLALIVIHVLLFLSYGYHRTLNKRPFSIHQWRQTDCLSIAKNYAEEGMDFFNPKIHWQGSHDGKAISEFPLINYSVASLWKVFGEHEAIYRLLVLSLYTLALLFTFVMFYLLSKSIPYSYFATLLLSTSPLLAYYSFNFLADVPALSFALIALSMYVIYRHNSKNASLYLSIGLSTLAILLKASAVAVLLIIGLCTVIDILKQRRENSSKSIFALLKPNLVSILAFGLAGTLILCWYAYAINYNQSSNGVFLMETLPIWKMNDKVIETARLLYDVQLSMYFNKGVLFSIFLGCIWLFLNFKSLSTMLQVSLVVSTLCTTGFILLFFQVFNVHDYYLINTMVFPVVVLGCFGYYLRDFLVYRIHKNLLILGLMIIAINTFHCASVVRLRTIENDWLTRINPFISNQEKNLSDWFFKNYRNTYKPLETITPYLRSLGIQRTDKVITMPDPSFNITLYLMDQKGYTLTEEALQEHEEKWQEYVEMGAKYLILNDTSLVKKVDTPEHGLTKLGAYEHILVYKISKPLSQ